MLKTSLLLVVVISAFGQWAPPGKERSFFNLGTPPPAGPKLVFNAVVEPPLADPAELKLGWGVFYVQERGRDVWHRFIYDTVHRQYFGYDLLVDPPEYDLLTNQPRFPGLYRIAFAPLSIQPDQLEVKNMSHVALPAFPDPQTLMAGDMIAVDLLVSEDGRRKVVDHIQIAPSDGAPGLRPFTRRVAFFKADDQTPSAVYQRFGRLSGLHVSLDQASLNRLSDESRKFNLELYDVIPEEALNMIALATHTFWKPTLGDSILVMQDLPRPTTAGDPKDYTLDDGPLKFDFIGEVLINGQRFVGPTWFLSLRRHGATPWFFFPGKGRFILSLIAHAGFVKSGEIRDNAISFQSGATRYQITMNSPVVEGGGAWNLYLLHDPSYQLDPFAIADLPSGLARSDSPMVIGGTGRLENLLPKPRKDSELR